MSRKPRRPLIGGLKPEGREHAMVCRFCFDLPHRRPQAPYVDQRTGQVRTGCPGCSLQFEAEKTSFNDLTPEEAAWQLLENQHARETAGVSTFEEALEVVQELFEDPDPGSDGRKTTRYCNVCFGMAHRRPPGRRCSCGGRFAPEILAIATGIQSSLAGFLDLDSIG
jgi:hypothetical protein